MAVLSSDCILSEILYFLRGFLYHLYNFSVSELSYIVELQIKLSRVDIDSYIILVYIYL